MTNYNLSAKLAADLGTWLFGGGTGWTISGCADSSFDGEYVLGGIQSDMDTSMYPYFTDGNGHYLYYYDLIAPYWRIGTTLGSYAYTYAIGATLAAGTYSGITLAALGVITAPTQPDDWTLHLLTAPASATSKGTEVSAGDYAAQAVTTITNTASIDFGIPSASWGTITGALLQDGNDTDRYIYFNVSPGVLTAADFRVIVPIGGLTEDPIGDWNVVSTMARNWLLLGTAITRPSWWVIGLLGLEGAFSETGYTPKPVNMVAVNATTNPGVFWNDAEADYGTAPVDWGVCTGWQLFPMYISYVGSVGPTYYFYDTFDSPMSFIEGQDIFWPAHGLSVDLLNPPS